MTDAGESDISYEYKYQKYNTMTPEEIVASLTLEQKAAQMVQPAIYMVTEKRMNEKCYGSILSKNQPLYYNEWQETVDRFQEYTITSECGIPYIYGQDDVHGVNYCKNAVYFPHNIGLGAANDPDLMYKIGLATADEAKLCHMLWNFAPCVAQATDPRWGRTYECYGSDLDMITKLSTAYTKGLVEGGVVACAKHFIGDGNVTFGSGENSDIKRLIDRGDASLTEEEIDKLMDVYKAQIEAGAQTVMISHSSLNSVKMHENGKYIMRLKDETGFEGFMVSDWNAVQNTSGKGYETKVINAVNSGIDMLMEIGSYDQAISAIVAAVNDGRISAERVDDAVTRIIRVKKNAGLFEDPMCEDLKTVQKETGSDEYRQLAEKAVEESLVLLKNEGGVLPLKEGIKLYVTGPAADNASVQCGGWTMDWSGYSAAKIEGVTTLVNGLRDVTADMGIEIITEAERAVEADAVLLFLGEKTYAEWHGDSEDINICGSKAFTKNKVAIEEAKTLGKPTIACIVAGRQVIISDYIDDWDAVVMCYLPGSEGGGVANVLAGKADFTGKLPSPWYGDVSQIGTDECMFEAGYGLNWTEPGGQK
ncbi:MAG: glycoside hydrolase family 3 C-terminal domain-containing protein [Lachnospiraceae bacterium]|nr:glycoside hydrolase family 3 C-terminal domain-containing protein [Lachnospiraceae bacterium]